MKCNDSRTAYAYDGRLLGDGLSPLVIATILPEEGETGVHAHIRQVRQYLARNDTPTTIVTSPAWRWVLRYPVLGPGVLLELCGCRAANLVWWRYFNEVFLRYALRRRLAKAGSCVIYAQEPLAARAAMRARRGPHQRVVLAVHFGTSQADESVRTSVIRHGGTVFRAIRRVEREVIPHADGLVYVSRWARNALLTWLPEAAGVPSAIIGNFVAPLRLEGNPEPLGDLVTTGRLDPVKNHRFLLDVLAEAKHSGRAFTLDIFGEGPLRPDLIRLARSLGLEEHIRFRGYRPDVRHFLPRYRAYVHASHFESSSLAIIEAMAAGLPVVAGSIGPIPELYEDGVEGRFWPLDDPAQAAAILTGLLDEEPARLKAAAAARERFRRDFDAKVIGPRLRSFLLETGTATSPRAVRAVAP